VNWPPREAEEVYIEENPQTARTNPELFLECCKKLLARSFYNYYGEHYHYAIPRKADGSLDLDNTLEEQTREVGDVLKAAVNQGEGTNQ
jgi:hypothetical protein